MISASPRLLTIGDTVYARDSLPGDMLVLDENGCPVWDRVSIADYVDPKTAKIADVVKVLIAAGLMKAE